MVYLCVYFLVLEHAWERCWQAGVCPQAAWTPGSIFPLPSAQGEVRDKQTTFYRNRNLHTCLLVSCGSQNSIKASHPSIRPSVHPHSSSRVGSRGQQPGRGSPDPLLHQPAGLNFTLLLLFSNSHKLFVCWCQPFLHPFLSSGLLLHAIMRRRPSLSCPTPAGSLT